MTTEIAPIIDHVDRALARLTSPFDDAVKLRALVSAMADGVQELERRLAWPIVAGLVTIQNATGSVLDTIGTMAGEPRNGRSDARYRGAIAVALLVATSHGDTARIARIAELLLGATGPVHVRTVPGGQVDLEVPLTATTEAALRAHARALMLRALSAGVALGPVVEVDDATFRLDDADRGLDVGLLGDAW